MANLNGVMMQYFHWYTPPAGSLWRETAAQAQDLAKAGVTAVWLPPAHKDCGGGLGVGYGAYDPYDLGEFNQKNSVRTKYGTRAEYLEAVRALRSHGVQVYADIVFNHLIGSDEFEAVKATPYPRNDRHQPKGPMREILAPTRFSFPGRGGKHSAFTWKAEHFDSVDYDHRQPEERDSIYLLEGKQFDQNVSLEMGNFDFLMGADLDFDHPEVRAELVRYGKWLLDTADVNGFRLDAAKHIPAQFWPGWLEAMCRHAGREMFCVAEYWAADREALRWFLDTAGPRVRLFDVPLHYNFVAASKAGAQYDLRQLLPGTLMQERPGQAVTIVMNHDSQPLQSLEAVVEAWFKPLAYAFILLRQEGYPCLFHPDYYGAKYEDFGRDGQKYEIVLPSHRFLLDTFLKARRDNAHGPQVDYFDHGNCIGWVRLGDEAHPKALAVLLSNGADGNKSMEVRRPGATFADLTGHVSESVTANQDGWAEFRCGGGSVSVWVEQ